MRGWLITSKELTPLETPQGINKIGAANLFLTFTDSPRQQELRDNYESLRSQSFQGIAPELQIDPEKLVQRNLKDSLGYAKLHSALIDTCLRDRNAIIESQKLEIVKLKAEITRLEAEKQVLNNSSLSSLILKKIKQKFLS